MIDLISRCRISSAMPFGWVIVHAFLAATVLGGVLAAQWLRGRPVRLAGGIVASLAATRLGLAVAAEVFVPVDWNPAVATANIVGLWMDGRRQLELRPDGYFNLAGAQPTTGTWRLDDWNLSLGGAQWRVVRAGGEERIIPNWPGDPDLWNGDLGFRRKQR